ncbi:hypothetical protein A2721_02355 [Candidatus Gottesmanbacteria bacterium RIFCSPHIGHO2_01_FULL_47_48]|uniref:EamA domain-containing protein n=1 Tax=Candidatus Gottesmanbacteria bacterium RIFCSPHIGHO2_01_FULL_47_48 TaxID=1798381 RepID=A0A1F6A2Q7_9BACT|nr:MAG: hypothetical protein A2721_02355 [Candidatus Gottesmanbacteria bacterium RIFCSPHIGHO2_01_FULL_47_48]
MPKKRTLTDYSYWPQVAIALSQVTFGLAWVSIFAPVDTDKITLIIFNLVATAGLLFFGHQLSKRK